LFPWNLPAALLEQAVGARGARVERRAGDGKTYSGLPVGGFIYVEMRWKSR
jgi:hypothetical protein